MLHDSVTWQLGNLLAQLENLFRGLFLWISLAKMKLMQAVLIKSVTSVTVISVLSECTGWPSAVLHLLSLECEDIRKELQCSQKIKRVKLIGLSFWLPASHGDT